MKKIVLAIFMVLIFLGVPLKVFSQSWEQLPEFYLKGAFTDPQWTSLEYPFKRDGNSYSIHMDRLDGEFKVSDEIWYREFGALDEAQISGSKVVPAVKAGANFKANNLRDVTISFTYDSKDPNHTTLTFIVGGSGHGDDPVINPEVPGISGTLPVLYINVYDESGNYNNEIISKDLDHKNYFTGEYWLDLNGVDWMEGAESLGSKESPLPLQIKARGNWTRKGFSKKPFKLKFEKKQSLLGMSKSKHFAILAHADDNFGYMRNFTGFNLGKRIGLPWTPSQQPVEVVINGDYRGLYFLTESIRVGDDRVMIKDLADNETDSSLCSGGYLVELDNYDEDNQIRMEERGTTWDGFRDVLRITFDTPEEYSEIQKRFITDQFSAMNDAIGENSDRLWSYMDLDDAARYYIVEEIISHTEAYHGSTYLFRDFGEGEKWHFSPLWDCGNAFNGSDNNYFTRDGLYGNTWIASLRQNTKFMDKVRQTWKWFMSQKFDGIEADLDRYSNSLKAAAQADYLRWNRQPVPDGGQAVIDNRNMDERLSVVKMKLRNKTSWLRDQWGDYNGSFSEPARDTTIAAELPEYVKPGEDPENPVEPEDPTWPKFYLRGEINGWDLSLPMVRNGSIYSIFVENLNGRFKLSNEDWRINYGAVSSSASETIIYGPSFKSGVGDGENYIAQNLSNVEISFEYSKTNNSRATLKFVVNGEEPRVDDPVIDPEVEGLSGTLPVLYINVYDESGNYNNEIISKDLDHKNYFTGNYWLDLNGVDWMDGAASVGSKESPLPLQIKARGNWTRKGFSKKPFKLKLEKKQSLLGMSKSKHFAILAHADDNYGYMRNFTGFNLGKRMGLPWTPSQQPVEVVINGDYRGLYFLTESIRVGDDRVMIQELNDLETDPSLVSGGYLVELDNYDEDNQIRMEEKGTTWDGFRDVLRITFDTPEEYSDIQRRFVEDQFQAMNDAIGDNSDRLWSYMDLDDAARYYIVEEIISHTEAYHGSTYLFRDRGEGQKWHFSPLWDCGNAFNGSDNNYFTRDGMWGNTWIASLRQNSKFMDKVRETWKWFMSQEYNGIENDLDSYCNSLKSAAQADYKRWNNQPVPAGGQAVIDNRNMEYRLNEVKSKLRNKTSWLRDQWGDYNNGFFAEPARDMTEAAPLPEYISTVVETIDLDTNPESEIVIYDLRGVKVDRTESGNIYIIRKEGKTQKVMAQ
ncbi:MAG: CotH kinase family protein [Muribaculaceae bacterium]|nr:CotH kinase family protein [Muribaculaceae bacterium]